jgi:hypothetical protein
MLDTGDSIKHNVIPAVTPGGGCAHWRKAGIQKLMDKKKYDVIPPYKRRVGGCSFRIRDGR